MAATLNENQMIREEEEEQEEETEKRFWLEPKHQIGSGAETTVSLFIEVNKWPPTRAYSRIGNTVFSLNSKCRMVVCVDVCVCVWVCADTKTKSLQRD